MQPGSGARGRARDDDHVRCHASGFRIRTDYERLQQAIRGGQLLPDCLEPDEVSSGDGEPGQAGHQAFGILRGQDRVGRGGGPCRGSGPPGGGCRADGGWRARYGRSSGQLRIDLPSSCGNDARAGRPTEERRYGDGLGDLCTGGRDSRQVACVGGGLGAGGCGG